MFTVDVTVASIVYIVMVWIPCPWLCRMEINAIFCTHCDFFIPTNYWHFINFVILTKQFFFVCYAQYYYQDCDCRRMNEKKNKNKKKKRENCFDLIFHKISFYLCCYVAMKREYHFCFRCIMKLRAIWFYYATCKLLIKITLGAQFHASSCWFERVRTRQKGIIFHRTHCLDYNDLAVLADDLYAAAAADDDGDDDANVNCVERMNAEYRIVCRLSTSSDEPNVNKVWKQNRRTISTCR